jgi:hypothetical protein
MSGTNDPSKSTACCSFQPGVRIQTTGGQVSVGDQGHYSLELSVELRAAALLLTSSRTGCKERGIISLSLPS